MTETNEPDGQPHEFGPPPGYGAPAAMLSSETSPILVSFADPAKQSRVTVLFRLLLAIPHLIAIYALGIAAEVVAFIGWWTALFTGQLPEWAHTFITGVLRWQARAYAYLFMLTDTYPPFSLDDEGYPVRLVSRPTRLNRLAVFFRIILAIPAAIVTAVAAYGLAVLSIFGWLIALVTGGLPPALHQAVAAIVRYVARYYGFFFMVTSEYPKGLYGDAPRVGGEAGPDIAAGRDIAGGPEPADAVATQPGQQAPVGDDPWRLPLSSAAKTLVTVCLIVGVAVAAGYGSYIGTRGRNTLSNGVALIQVEQANSVLGRSMTSFPAAVQACGSQLSCVTALDLKLSTSLETFAGSIKAISFSGPATSAAASLVSDTNATASDLRQLGGATSVSQYQSIVNTGSFQQDFSHVETDYSALVKDLTS